MQTGARKTSGTGSGNTAGAQGSRARRAPANAGPSRFKVTDWPDEAVPDIPEDPEASRSRSTAGKARPSDSTPSLGFKDFVWPESSTSL
jgi:hypothetical protein